MGEPQLPYSAQALEEWVFDQIKYRIVWYFNKSVDRIIDDFQLISGRIVPHVGYLWPQNYVFIAIIGFVSAKKHSCFLQISAII